MGAAALFPGQRLARLVAVTGGLAGNPGGGFRFGDGVILNFEGAGAQARVQVNFSEGSKWLMLGYAKLEAI